MQILIAKVLKDSLFLKVFKVPLKLIIGFASMRKKALRLGSNLIQIKIQQDQY